MKKMDNRKEELRRHWHAHVVAWRESGLSRQGYARRHGLYKNAIRYWNNKFPADSSPISEAGKRTAALQTPISATSSVPRPSEVRFIPVDFPLKKPDTRQEPLTLRGGRRFRIIVPNRFSQEALARLIRTLGEFS